MISQRALISQRNEMPFLQQSDRSRQRTLESRMLILSQKGQLLRPRSPQPPVALYLCEGMIIYYLDDENTAYQTSLFCSELSSIYTTFT